MKISKLTIWTVVLNFFILIGAGHGIAPIGLVQFGWFSYLNLEEFTLSPTSSYDSSLPAVALFCFLGQITLITSIFS